MQILADRLAAIKARRQARVNREGSPFYRWVPAAINTLTHSYIWIEAQFPAAAKYAPLDWYEIVNNSGENLTITINGVQQHLVPAGTIRIDDNTAVHSFDIYNESATNTVEGEVVVTFQRQPVTEDRLLRGQR